MDCPCCSTKLLAHVNDKGMYWYCLYCREIMPVIESKSIEKRKPLQNCEQNIDNGELKV